ncbi:hypothetical protein [Planococcus salinarum]|uniref:hypothetical protein n=1 Tax=Planococcus salinarum TaxID=622695 RepID=UPI00115EEF00|nr:hypothetical protein [Planococcus salinarum]TAA69233.1 hypothetical protein D2909_13055 [Planococcus salinarum]
MAVIYCFIYWKLSNLGGFRKPLFAYAVVVQLSFLILYAWINNAFKGDINFSREWTDAYAIGIIIFYFLMILPFFIALGIHIYKGVGKLEITRTAKVTMMIIYTLFSLVFSVTGFYLHLFFYYGLAP